MSSAAVLCRGSKRAHAIHSRGAKTAFCPFIIRHANVTVDFSSTLAGETHYSGHSRAFIRGLEARMVTRSPPQTTWIEYHIHYATEYDDADINTFIARRPDGPAFDKEEKLCVFLEYTRAMDTTEDWIVHSDALGLYYNEYLKAWLAYPSCRGIPPMGFIGLYNGFVVPKPNGSRWVVGRGCM